jgi:biopolymer transport protein ExbB
MIEQIKKVLVHAGATWVIWLLVGLSALSVAVMLDRARVFWRQRSDLGVLAEQLHRLLGAGDVDGARAVLSRSSSAAASVVAAGLSEWGRGAEAAREAMAAAAGLQRARLERRLLFLGTVGNNAPFVGLLGTVIGVVGAFAELGSVNAGAATASAQLAPERIMNTIAEALVATAIGLLVAIPAVAVFNYFQGLLTAALNDADTLGHVLLAHVDRANRGGAGAPERMGAPRDIDQPVDGAQAVARNSAV